MTVSIGADPADTVPRQHLRRLIAVDRTGLVLTIVAVLGALIWGFPIYFSIFETLKPRATPCHCRIGSSMSEGCTGA